MGYVFTTDMEHGFSNLQGCQEQGLTSLWAGGGQGEMQGEPGVGRTVYLGTREPLRAFLPTLVETLKD